MTDLALGTDINNPPAPPDDLGRHGLALWSGVLGRYSLRVDEVLLLEQAARCADDLERLRLALRDADLIVLGSMRQTVANPLLGEARQLRATLASHLRQLGLPDEPVAGAERPKSPRHQRAARARWAAHDYATAVRGAQADSSA